MEFWDAHRVHQIIKGKRREMEAALGPFVCSGKSIYILAEIETSMQFKTVFRGQKLQILIDKPSMVEVRLGDSVDGQARQVDHAVMYQMLNIIIKQAFRETSLKQVGRAPRFFDVKNPLIIKQAGLQIWSGFKAAAV